MIRALYSAASGMCAQELNIDNIANNLANANTVGYKSRRAQFQDLMYQSMVQPGSAIRHHNGCSGRPSAGAWNAHFIERDHIRRRARSPRPAIRSTW